MKEAPEMGKRKCIAMHQDMTNRLGTKATQVGEGAVLGRKLAHFYFQKEGGN
jgi:hypothetical protein